MTFLANENFPFPSIRILRSKGLSIKSIGEECSGISDKEVIEIAQKEKLIILTFDRDYGELILKHGLDNPPAVVYFRLKGDNPEYAGNLLLTLMDQSIPFENHFTVIETGSLRQRRY